MKKISKKYNKKKKIAKLILLLNRYFFPEFLSKRWFFLNMICLLEMTFFQKNIWYKIHLFFCEIIFISNI